MKFMMLVCVDGASFDAEEEAAAETDSGDDGSFPWLDDVIARGVRLDGDRLRPPREAKTVQVRDGEVMISDGPFAETKEVICGFEHSFAGAITAAVGGAPFGGRGGDHGGDRRARHWNTIAKRDATLCSA